MKIKCKLCGSIILNNTECKCKIVKLKDNIIQINTNKHILGTYYDFITELKEDNNDSIRLTQLEVKNDI